MRHDQRTSHDSLSNQWNSCHGKMRDSGVRCVVKTSEEVAQVNDEISQHTNPVNSSASALNYRRSRSIQHSMDPCRDHTISMTPKLVNLVSHR